MKINGTHRRNFAILESCGNAIDLKLPVDVGLLGLDVGWAVDLCGRHDEWVLMEYTPGITKINEKDKGGVSMEELISSGDGLFVV